MATRIGAGSLTTGQADNYGLGGGGNSPYIRTDNVVSSSGAGTSSAVSSGSQVQTESSNSVQNASGRTTNMTPQQLAALDSLIRQLAAGGTPEMRAAARAREIEQTNISGLRSQFSKEAAFGDAQGAISQQMRRALESMLPSINRAAEDAGSSGGALRALLLQDAANKAAESSSVLGLQTATNYGGIATNLSQVMASLLAQGDNVATEALVQALNVAKGSVVTSDETRTTTGTGSRTTSSQESKSGVSAENKTTSTDFAPLRPVVSTSPLYFGPSAPDDVRSFAGTSAHNMAQLADALSGGSAWSNYTF